jgi:hypothetical protein
MSSEQVSTLVNRISALIKGLEEPGIMVHACNSSAGETETGGS